MNREQRRKEITVEELLVATKGKEYSVTGSDMSRVFTIIKGDEIPLHYRTDTLEKIISYSDGSFVLDYGKGVPHYKLILMDNH